jgi:hypothetical protein
MSYKLQVTSYKSGERGFSLFIAMIVSAVLLIIAVAVTDMATKETIFSSFGRESQYAIFAADAGIECALYWDSKFNSFATSTPGAPINCNGVTMSTGGSIPSGQAQATSTLTRIGGGGNSNPTSAFGFSLNSGTNLTNACAIVTVNKYYDGPDLITHIFSRGYNTCDASNPRRVERGIEVKF